MDVLNIGLSLDLLTRDRFQNLLLRLRKPHSNEELRQDLRRVERDGIQTAQERADYEREQMNQRRNPTGRIAVAI